DSSAFFSTRGFGVSTLGASFTPLVISEKSFSLTRSTGSDSAGVTSNVFPEKDKVAHSSTAACRPAEIAVAFLITALSLPAQIRYPRLQDEPRLMTAVPAPSSWSHNPLSCRRAHRHGPRCRRVPRPPPAFWGSDRRRRSRYFAGKFGPCR